MKTAFILCTIAILCTPMSFLGCLPWAGMMPDRKGSIGTSSRGILQVAEPLKQDSHFRFYRKFNRHYGVPDLTGMVKRAAQKVAQEFKGSVLLVGDLSGKGGGFISEHRSHRSGLDVDLAFYVTDKRGRNKAGAPLIRFDRFGVGTRDGKTFRFDTIRNWHLVAALLEDEQADVQWIFVSNGLKAKLLQWALLQNEDINLIHHAAAILHQPGDSAPHDDHFHVRITCPKDQTGKYCIETNPRWPWAKKTKPAPLGFTKDALARLALED